MKTSILSRLTLAGLLLSAAAVSGTALAQGPVREPTHAVQQHRAHAHKVVHHKAHHKAHHKVHHKHKHNRVHK